MSASSSDSGRRPDEHDELVSVGRIVKPHGIRGEVVVAPLSDRTERFAPGAVLVVGRRSFAVLESRPHQGRLLVRLEGIGDRSAAERLRGAELHAARGDGEPSESYLASELVGMPVRGPGDRDLGEVIALIELPDSAGYDLLEVARPDGSTWLLPAVDEYVVVEVDAAGTERIVLVDPPDGLVNGS
jgi:16S rRNA processing protein RimM